ncbi:hypothetical protein KR074_000307 [Drosophila pseudoananassae]|nr:hypothetical protein KR074_000307 [Drosophila pseudoananassae]
MNQFHTPSFGDEVFELNDSVQPAESPQPSSRRMLSLDHSTFNDDDEEVCHSYGSGQNLVKIDEQPQQLLQHHQVQQQQLVTQQPHIVTQQPPKPLAPFALFFRDTVTAIKQQNPACSLEQMQVIVQTMWESLDETQKNVYSQRHEQEKRDYVRLMRDYRQHLDTTEEAPLAPDLAPQLTSVAPLIQPKVEVNPEPLEEQQPVATAPGPPDQIQLLNEAATVQKCTREQCNKPAIINPDWEDEYCSNECVVIHCRNVFNEWALTLKNSPS